MFTVIGVFNNPVYACGQISKWIIFLHRINQPGRNFHSVSQWEYPKSRKETRSPNMTNNAII